MAFSIKVNAYEVDANLNNTSYVQVDVSATTTGGSYNLTGSAFVNGSVTGQNNSYSISNTSFTIGQNTTKTIYSAKFGPFTHNSDGSLNPVQIYIFAQMVSGTTANSTIYCNMSKIPRTSVPTLSSNYVTVGTTVTIYTNRASDSFLHNLSYKPPNSDTYYTFAQSIGADYPWKVPNDLISYFPNSSSGLFQIKCDTYSSGNYIGSEVVNVTIMATQAGPSYTMSISEGEQDVINSKVGVYVQNKSKIKITFSNISLYYNSPLRTCLVGIQDSQGQTVWNDTITITGNDKTATSYSVTTPVLTRSGSFTVHGLLYDERWGYGPELTATYTSLAYSPPTITNVSVARATNQGLESENGTYLKYTFVSTISSLNNKNTKSWRIYYKQSTSSSFSNYINLTSSSYTLNNVGLTATSIYLNTNYIYDIRFEANDIFNIPTQVDRQLGSDFRLMNFNASGKSMTLGGISGHGSSETVLESHLTIDCWNGLLIKGQDILNMLYPINIVVIFYDANDHSKFLGFTWERVILDRIPKGYSPTAGNAIGAKTGSWEHVMTIDEMPSHRHGVAQMNDSGEGRYGAMTTLGFTAVGWNDRYNPLDAGTASIGGNQPLKWENPTEVVAFWRRTS